MAHPQQREGAAPVCHRWPAPAPSSHGAGYRCQAVIMPSSVRIFHNMHRTEWEFSSTESTWNGPQAGCLSSSSRCRLHGPRTPCIDANAPRMRRMRGMGHRGSHASLQPHAIAARHSSTDAHAHLGRELEKGYGHPAAAIAMPSTLRCPGAHGLRAWRLAPRPVPYNTAASMGPWSGLPHLGLRALRPSVTRLHVRCTDALCYKVI